MATLSRHAADDPLVGEIVGEALAMPRGNAPLRLYGALHYLVLAGRAPAYAELADPWPAVRAILEEHRDSLRSFVAEHAVQTNEVRRSWLLLPGFLWASDGRPLELVELGASGGLNLLWDRYRYVYAQGTWGPEDAPMTLMGPESPEVPGELLEREVRIGNRVGIDRNPIDVTTEEGALLLQCYVWPDQPERLERMRRAIAAVRANPPELVAGDFLELLPSVLEARSAGARTIVFHSMVTEYVEDADYARLEDSLRQAGEAAPLVELSVEFPRTKEFVSDITYLLEAREWPSGERRQLARVHYHGAGLRWLA
ncbi:MAG: hypothetical protein QOF50_85 [Gaiellaceae bacterium]|nr:hypothetical protein [Gaiellaceae bacterium]